jgi:hypothetical protein
MPFETIGHFVHPSLGLVLLSPLTFPLATVFAQVANEITYGILSIPVLIEEGFIF